MRTSRRPVPPVGPLLALLLLFVPTPRARAQPPDAFAADVATLATRPRPAGSAGLEAAFDYVRNQVAALPGVEVREQTYPLLTPQTRLATLAPPGGPAEAVYPFFPANVRLNATPAGGVTAPLVYCGRGTFAELPAARLRGAIAVLEADTADWDAVAQFGPAAFVFLGNPRVTHATLRTHELPLPADLPRFYLPDGPLAERVRHGIDGDARLNAVADWTPTLGRNLYAFVPAQNPLPLSAGQGRPGRPSAALTVVVPLDATGIVPDAGVGAGQACGPATALRLLRDLAARPPRRPVLVCFTGADGYNLLGTRHLLMALADPPAKWRYAIEGDLDPVIQRVGDDLEHARWTEGDPAKLGVTRDRSLIDRIVKEIETDVSTEQDELFRLRVLPADQQSDVTRGRMMTLQDRQIRLAELKYAFQSQPATLGGFPEARVYLRKTLARLGGVPHTAGLANQLATRKVELRQRVGLYEWLASRLGRDADPGLRAGDVRLIELMVGLDLSDAGVRCGPVFWGRAYNVQTNALVLNYAEWLAKQSPGPWLDCEPLKQTRSHASYLAAPLSLPAELGQAWGVPAMTFATLGDARPRRDTPNDTLAALNLDAVRPQADATLALLRRAFDDPAFVGPPEFRRTTNAYEGQVVSTASGRPIPDLPREGFLATYDYLAADRKIPLIRQMPYCLGVRRLEVQPCDADGRYRFDGLPRLVDQKKLVTKVYRVEPGTGKISGAGDLGRQAADLPTIVNLDGDITPVKSVVFDCREVTLTNLYDPRLLQGLGEVQLIDARRNAEPQRFDISVLDRIAAAFVEPGSRLDYLFRYGRVGNRLVLLNLPEKGNGVGRGYTPDDVEALGPVPLATARDFWRLNDGRLAEYRRAGVTSGLIDAMHAKAGEQIRSADAALTAGHAPELLRNATGAWANEARVYDAAGRMANDVIYAAIFLLLLSVPFAFCMERLLVGTPNVYAQIAWACGVFAGMAGLLWLFHPAFKISASPLIIILAFAIMLMSGVVIAVVYGKFDAELKRLKSGRAGGEGTGVAAGSVLASAVLLGLANMRRRKFRTFLTATTVVLITFAVLCFTSATKYQGTIALPTGIDSQFAGLLLRQRGFRPVPTDALEHLRAAYPGRTFVEHWWTADAVDPKHRVELVAGGGDGTPPRVAALPALLGVSPGESDLSAARDVVPGFDRLERGETDVIYLSLATAAQLKVQAGDAVSLGGRRLTVAGLYDAAAFDQRMALLSGEPVAPLRYSSGALDAGGRKLTDTNADTLDLDAGDSAAEAGASYEHLPGTQFAIVPAAVSRTLENTTLRTVAVRVAAPDAPAADRDAAVQGLVADVTQRFALATFAGYSGGVSLVSAGNLSSLGGGANVIVPLAIGGLIIFNTMMGSIAERRREIHVYTSLGLAPFHVGALFVAEAMTYGLIGSVFGYVLGQGVGTVLLKLGWLGGVTLNYSGTSAMLTLGLILLIVLLSALVPARLAGKIAAPSIERTWRVPSPADGRIVADLPFTINGTAAEGVVGYLAEWFDGHGEGSIGKFSVGRVEAFADVTDDGQPVRGLKTVVWLTPFDLGVRQHLLLLIHPGAFADIYDVQVVLERLSGDDGSWWRMNRAFLTELRKQFLQWRSLSPQRMREYVEQSHALFADIPTQVVTTERSEEVRLA